MKKINYSIFAIAAAIAISGCQKSELTDSTSAQGKTISFTSVAEGAKSVFGTPDGTTYPTLWTEYNANLKVITNLSKEATATAEPSQDGKTIHFNYKVNQDLSAPYKFVVMSPIGAYTAFSSSNKSLTISVPTSQTTNATSPDEAAQVLYSVSESFSALPEKVDLTFKHFTAYGHIGFKNLALGDAKLQSVSLTAEKDWAGRFFLNIEDNGTVKAGDITISNGSKTIAVATESSEDIWFACAPTDLGGTKLAVTVTTDKGTFSKDVTIPAGKAFEAGKIAKFSIDMNGITISAPKEYLLVKDASELKVGCEVIIAAMKYDRAISTTKNTNNRAEASIVKSEDKSKVSSPAANVQIFTLEKGTKEGTFAFFAGDGYICAASSSSNYMKTEAALSDNSSFTVAVNDTTATITAQGTYTRNTLFYNLGSTLFSCYLPTNTSMEKVCIYQYDDGKKSLDKPVLDVATDDVDKKIVVYWNDVANAVNYTVSCTGQADITASSGDDGCVFENLEYGVDYTITVVANPAEGYRQSSASETVKLNDPKPVISYTQPAFVAQAGGNVEVTYNVTNAIAGKSISAVSNQTWVKNFDYSTANVLKFTVEANTTGAEREATVTLSYEGADNASFTLTQKAAGFCYEAMDPANVREGIYFIAYDYTDGAKYLLKNAVQSTNYSAATKYEDITSSTTIDAGNLFYVQKSGEGYTISNNGKYVSVVKSGSYYNLKPLETSPAIWNFTSAGTEAIAAETVDYPGNYMSFSMYTNKSTGVQTPEYTTATDKSNCPVFYYYSAIPSYLHATADGSTAFAAAGGSLTISVNSNVDWTVSSSDATNFAVAKTNATTATVTVSANTGAQRTATITIGGTGVDDVKIELTQAAKSVAGQEYTAEITIASFNGNKSWSSYANITGSVEGSDLATYNIAGDMICWNKDYIQHRQNKSSVIYNTSSFGKIKSITFTDDTAALFTVTTGSASKDGCTTAVTADSTGRVFTCNGADGFFKVTNANTTIAHTTKIVVVYTK